MKRVYLLLVLLNVKEFELSVIHAREYLQYNWFGVRKQGRLCG